MELKKPNKQQLKLLKQLYLTSFPKYERKPFKLMQALEKCGKMEILCIVNNENFCGLVITASYKDLVLIDYFAISEDLRGKGIGSQSIELIRKRYSGKRIFLEIESTLKKSPNMDERKKRKDFYLRNKLSECGISVLLFGVEMELLTFGKPITYEEYQKLYKHLIGNIASNKIAFIE